MNKHSRRRSCTNTIPAISTKWNPGYSQQGYYDHRVINAKLASLNKNNPESINSIPKQQRIQLLFDATERIITNERSFKNYTQYKEPRLKSTAQADDHRQSSSLGFVRYSSSSLNTCFRPVLRARARCGCSSSSIGVSAESYEPDADGADWLGSGAAPGRSVPVVTLASVA